LTAQDEILKLPYLALIVSMLLTLGATYLFYQGEKIKEETRFLSETIRIKNRIDSKVNSYIAILKAGRGFIESSRELDKDKFSAFVSSLEIEKNNPDVQGIGYTKRIKMDEREALIKRMKAEGYSDFKIFPLSQTNEFQSTLYLEPLNPLNQREIGFDMSSEPARREALEKSRDTGQASVTGKISPALDTETENQPGFLIYLPIYKGGKIPQTVADRKQLLDGFVYSQFRTEEFLREVQNSSSIPDISIALYDSEKKADKILGATNKNITNETPSFTAINELEIAGRKWIIEYESLPSFEAQSSLGWTPLIFTSGLIFSLLLFGMTYLESYARAKAEKITVDLQESEMEKGFLLEREQIERQRAEQASRSKDEFISIVSHELRTPLNSIAGWSRILHAENLSEVTKKQALQTIEKNLRVQTKIVEELLDFSQILSGRKDLVWQEVDFIKIFEEACDESSLLAKAKGVSLVKEISLNGQKIFGDDKRLRKVIKNLLSNAIKFTPEGGGILAEIKEADGMVEMKIKDNGQGIKSDFLPFIFERFKQADSSSTRRHGGLGLGLAISRHIVELHGGSIRAESEGEGKGALFTVKFPLKKND